ncbi:MAG TPA: APC family permease [Candidatus Baltobacteraceae bacterium]|nr:APC family permease [Candidatus Baltobacteraceae bacterium]
MQLRRSLGLVDVALFFLVACTNLQWIATAAAAGPSSLPVWLIGAAGMFVPLAVVVMYLSSRYPEEGGMYVWSKRAFGPFAGFITGWTYWCSNLPYFPALLYFMAGNALFIWGSGAQAASPAYFVALSLGGFAFATLLNVLGFDVAKWLNNAGALSRWIVTLLLIGLGLFAWFKFGAATRIDMASVRPSVQLKDVIFWSVIAFAWTGAESVPFVAGEVKDARRTVPRGLAIAVPAIAAVYILGTASVLIAMPAHQVSGLYGVMQSIARVSAQIGWFWLTPVAAILVALSCLGSTGAWLGSVARIPFVAGIDRYLPPAFGRMHPRWGSPVAALLTQAGIAAIFIFLGQGGTTVKGAYDVLVSSTVLITMIPFLFVFGSALRLSGGRFTVITVAIVGLFTTVSALVLAAFPSDDDPNKVLAVIKILGLTALVLGGGVAVYLLGGRRKGEVCNQLTTPSSSAADTTVS